MALTKAHNRMIADAAVNVKDFGAVGDGVADDTAAIQAALNTLKDVHFGGGSYRITSPLSVSAQRVIGGVIPTAGWNRAQTEIIVDGNISCFVNSGTLGEPGLEIDGFLIKYSDSIPADAITQGDRVGINFSTNNLYPAYTKIQNVTVKGAWIGYRDDTGTYQTILERVFFWNCRYGVLNINGTTIKFDTVSVLGGLIGFELRDILSPTLINCFADQLTPQSGDIAGNIFRNCQSLTIAGWDAESNVITGNNTSYMQFDNTSAHVSGFTGYLNELTCNSGEEVYLFDAYNGSTVTFSGIRPRRGSGDLDFTGNAAGVPKTISARTNSDVFICGSQIDAATGTSSAPLAVGGDGTSTVLEAGNKLTDTTAFTETAAFGPTTSGSWTPNPTNYTTVGTVPVVGRYLRENNVVHCWIEFQCDGSNTIASTAGTSAINNFPNSLTPTRFSTCTATDTAVNDLGSGLVNTFGIYTPTFSASTVPVHVYFAYYIGSQL